MATRTGAHCPKCDGKNIPVIHNQASRDGLVVFRKRECRDCGFWVSTEERIEEQKRNLHEERLVMLYKRLSHAHRKALWSVLKLMR